MKLRKALVVVKQSALEKVRAKYGIDKKGAHYASLMAAAKSHFEASKAVIKKLRSEGVKFDVRKRLNLPRLKKSLGHYDLVISVGGDGTLLNVSHYVKKTPLLGVNSAPESSVGLLCGAFADNFSDVIDKIVSGKLKPKVVQRAQAYMGNRTVGPPALNEILFSHKVPAATSRYRLRSKGVEAAQKSSGVWVITPAGSTAVGYAAGAKIMPIGSTYLQFIVREPYPDEKSAKITKGVITPGGKLELLSTTHNGMIYVDGQTTPNDVPFGKKLAFRLSPHPLNLIGYNKEKRDMFKSWR